MELKKRLFSSEPTAKDEALIKVSDGLYKCGKLTIRVTCNEPSETAIKNFNRVYNEIIARHIS